MDWFAIGVTALWAMGPAYVPNNAAVLAGGGKPIDGNRTWGGRRLLGDGKTWRGALVGIGAGVAVAVLMNGLSTPVGDAVGVSSLPVFSVVVALALAGGAVTGDILASFLKRRLGRDRGESIPLLDQLDFVVLALGVTWLSDPMWVTQTFQTPELLVVLVVTPLLHVGSNVVAYLLGVKNVPW